MYKSHICFALILSINLADEVTPQTINGGGVIHF